MGLPPGPPRDPNSRRGEREARWAAQAAEQGVTQPVPELRMPDGDKSVDEVWQDMGDQLTAANVPLQQVDAYSIELRARAVVNMRKAERLTEAEEEKVASTSPSPGNTFAAINGPYFPQELCQRDSQNGVWTGNTFQDTTVGFGEYAANITMTNNHIYLHPDGIAPDGVSLGGMTSCSAATMCIR